MGNLTRLLILSFNNMALFNILLTSAAMGNILPSGKGFISKILTAGEDFDIGKEQHVGSLAEDPFHLLEQTLMTLASKLQKDQLLASVDKDQVLTKVQKDMLFEEHILSYFNKSEIVTEAASWVSWLKEHKEGTPLHLITDLYDFAGNIICHKWETVETVIGIIKGLAPTEKICDAVGEVIWVKGDETWDLDFAHFMTYFDSEKNIKEHVTTLATSVYHKVAGELVLLFAKGTPVKHFIAGIKNSLNVAKEDVFDIEGRLIIPEGFCMLLEQPALLQLLMTKYYKIEWIKQFGDLTDFVHELKEFAEFPCVEAMR